MSNIIEAQFVVTEHLLSEITKEINTNVEVYKCFRFLAIGAFIVALGCWIIPRPSIDFQFFTIDSKLASLGYAIIAVCCFLFELYYRHNSFQTFWKAGFLNTSFLINIDFNKNEISFKKTHTLGIYSCEWHFSDIERATQSKDCIYLKRGEKAQTLTCFIKKEALTYADFQRLQEAIPCLQSLSIDPQQFKQGVNTLPIGKKLKRSFKRRPSTI